MKIITIQTPPPAPPLDGRGVATGRAWIALFLLFMLGLPAAASDLDYSKNKPLVVGIDADFPPLEYVDEAGMPRGYDVEFTKLLMKRLGIHFTYAPNTWEKISGDVLHGNVDLGMMIYSNYRKDSTNYSRAVFRMYYQIVYHKSMANTFDARNLRGKRIAYMKSRPVGEMLDSEGAVKMEVVNMDKAMYGLMAEEYDAVVCFRYQSRYYFEQKGMSGFVADELSLQPREYCYVSHNKTLIDLINRELRLMEEEGIIDDVYGKKIKSHFGSIEIPSWVWYLLAAVIFLSLAVMTIIFYVSERRLQAEHKKLLKAYDLLAEKNQALQLATDRAEESSRMKSNFIKQISHEIRTPLNAVSGFAQIMTSLGSELDEDTMSNATQQIVSNTERITKLVNKMLELSDASSKKVISRTDSVTVAQIVEMAADSARMNEQPHVVFSIDMPQELGSQVLVTGKTMASRALTLLLDNAQKFQENSGKRASAVRFVKDVGKKGSVVLRVRTSPSGPTPQFVDFIVEDTGIGVPKEEAEHIFNEFVQLDEYYDGTGIGLTVARSIARRLGGNIVLDTDYTGGARFVLTLPI